MPTAKHAAYEVLFFKPSAPIYLREVVKQICDLHKYHHLHQRHEPHLITEVHESGIQVLIRPIFPAENRQTQMIFPLRRLHCKRRKKNNISEVDKRKQGMQGKSREKI